MTEFVQLVIDGIADGSIYGAVALSLVLIYRTRGVLNSARGEMAMFSTFVAWGLLQAGLPLGAALALTLVLSFLGGMVIERVIIRPVEGGEPLVLVIVTVGSLILSKGGGGSCGVFATRSSPSLFGNDSIEVAGVRIDVESLGIVAVMLA